MTDDRRKGGRPKGRPLSDEPEKNPELVDEIIISLLVSGGFSYEDAQAIVAEHRAKSLRR